MEKVKIERVKVFLRVKAEETVEDETLSIYNFDRVFKGRDQDSLFTAVSPLIEMALEGFNTTVFTYGQTGSGKTYTMEGTEVNPGLIPLTLRKIFKENNNNIFITVIEIYNEKIYNLLQKEKETVKIRESGSKIFLDKNIQEECDSLEGAMEVFKTAVSNRRTGTNGVNSESSRSHMVFIIETEKGSKITLVDLAGSEKHSVFNFSIKKIKPENPEKSLESSNINKSLLYLSRIINKLSEGSTGHINYRDSKLTFILRDSLNQDSLLAVIGTVDLNDQIETKSTINFLCTAKKIRLNIKNLSPENTEELKMEIKKLTEENKKLKKENMKVEEIKKQIKKIREIEEKVERIENTVGLIEKKNNELGNALFNKIYNEKIEEIKKITENYP